MGLALTQQTLNSKKHIIVQEKLLLQNSFLINQYLIYSGKNEFNSHQAKALTKLI